MTQNFRLLILAYGIDGGIAFMSSHLARGLQKEGVDGTIRYVGRPADSCFTEKDKLEGVNSAAIMTGKARSLADAWGLLRSVVPIMRAVRQIQPDAVIFAGFIPALLYPLFLRPLSKARFVFWDHGPQNTFSSIKKLLFPLSLGCFDRIVSISQSTAGALTSYFGIKQDSIHLIHNGIDPAPWRGVPPAPAFSTLRILMPARLELNQKDPLTLIKAAAILHAQGVPVEVTFVGSGIHENIVRDAIVEHKAENYIRLIPHASDIPSLLKDYNVVCLSTKFEGLPTVLIEGMMARRLIVATRAEGCVDVVEEDVTGFLFAPQDAQDCAQKLLNVMNHHQIQEMIAAAYQKALAQFSTEIMLSKFKTLLFENETKP